MTHLIHGYYIPERTKLEEKIKSSLKKRKNLYLTNRYDKIRTVCTIVNLQTLALKLK